MRKLLLFIAGLSLCCIAWGPMGLQIAGMGASAPDSGISYLINQNLEGTGYDNSESWTEYLVSDEDYTTIALRGSQSLRVYNSDSNVKSPTYSSPSTAYGRFMVQFDALPTGTTRFFALYNSSTRFAEIHQQSNGRIQVQLTGGTTVYAASGYAMSEDSTYYIWWEYTAGSGSDASFEVWQAATSTKPGSSVGSITDGTSTADNNAIRVESNNSMDVVFDQFLVADEEIGSGDAP